jgi:hypothetical protein
LKFISNCLGSGFEEDVSNKKIQNPKKQGLKMLSIIPNHGTCEKIERGYLISSRFKEKPLSVFQNEF